MSTEPTLVERLLAKPTAPAIPAGNPDTKFTRRLEVKGDTVDTEVRQAEDVADACDQEGTARALMAEYGLNPDEFQVTAFRVSDWTMANGEKGRSTRFSFGRIGTAAVPDPPNIDELIAVIEALAPEGVVVRATGDHTFIIALGDMQFGKIDGDGVEGALARCLDFLQKAADVLAFYRLRFDIGHIHIAWLGDHIEGFTSQGGANTWRTQLTLNEQIRLVRRVMLHAMILFAPLAERVTMVAVPGNHGRVEVAAKGVTRYDDSHDTESLIAVSEAAAVDPERFGHVEFYVPETDEMTVVLNLSGTRTGHVHGQQFKPGKHFDWWEGQAFGGSPLTDADLLLAGHLHHFLHEETGVLRTLDGEDVVQARDFLQVPALEDESTWYRHSRGVRGVPGIVVAVTKDGRTGPIEVIR